MISKSLTPTVIGLEETAALQESLMMNLIKAYALSALTLSEEFLSNLQSVIDCCLWILSDVLA